MTIITASVGVIATVIFTWRQVKFQSASLKNDDARISRETALFLIEMLNSEEFRVNRHLVAPKFQKAPQNLDDGEKAAFRALLHAYGKIALAYLHGGVRLESLQDYWSGPLNTDWERLASFASAERVKHRNRFRNTETLARDVGKAISG